MQHGKKTTGMEVTAFSQPSQECVLLRFTKSIKRADEL